MTGVSMPEADAVAAELERRGLTVGTRGIFAVGDHGEIRLWVQGTGAQWQALLAPALSAEQVAWLEDFAVHVSALLVRSNPGAPELLANDLRQWLAQQQGGGGGR